MSAPQSAAGQRNARPTPHWSSGNGHLTSLQAADFPASAGCWPAPSVMVSPANKPAMPSARPRYRRVVRSFHLDLIVLDQRIGEELVGRLLERGLRRFAIAPLDLDIEDFALAHARHAFDAQRFERPFDRLALGIEDAGFEGDGDAGLHRDPASIDMARIGQSASTHAASPSAR